ncbi:DUF2746 domain-containing protein [Tsukamurella soli]|uniref:Gas vesicle protein n=1 Tax=Tsukamurella soli TaxID=644556 RepID=A0ABP8K2B6_9ACTN
MPNVPSDYWGVIIVILAGLFGVVSAVVGPLVTVRVARRQTQELVQKHIGPVADQVKNTHETNMRDDIDKILSEVRMILRQLADIDHRTARIGDEVRINRDEFVDLRKDTYELSARVERVIAKHHPQEVD